VFLKTPSSNKFIHTSSLPIRVLSELRYNGEFKEYTLNLKALGEDYVDMCIVTRSEEYYSELFKINSSSKRVYYTGRSECLNHVSTGFPRIDALIESIAVLRRSWCIPICKCPERSIKYYEAFLKAKVAHIYSFYKRIKDAWLEYAQEYLGFIYWVLDSVLREHCQIINTRGLSDICKRACSSESIEWRNLIVEYDCREKSIRVYLERMLNGVKPDILVETLNKRIAIECKQGPIKTWLKKAIKQAEKYKALFDTCILITPQLLSESDIIVLKQQYDIVVDKCTTENLECRKALHQVLLESRIFT